MRIHYLQHVPFEGLGSMERALLSRGHQLSCTRLFAGDTLPALTSFDALIVMGGPMGVYDEATLPWLAAEKQFIHSVVTAGKRVLGICLGAQLLACVLGARVDKNAYREIGWWPVTRRPDCVDSKLAGAFPEELDVFHWHGDTFTLPDGAQLLASSTGCRNQGFVWNERVLALQFHLETTPQTAQDLCHHCHEELDNSRFVQSAHAMLAQPERFTAVNQLMSAMLDRWLA
ncbi:MAG: type 1 glutamine amidotransferase [Pseudomonadota bacterium]